MIPVVPSNIANIANIAPMAPPSCSRRQAARRAYRIIIAQVVSTTCTYAGLTGGGSALAETPHQDSRAETTDTAALPATGTAERKAMAAERPLPLGYVRDEPLGRDQQAVDLLCKAAVALALAEPERARGFITRARLAGWLPEVHFRVYRRFARTEGLTLADSSGGNAAPVDISAVDDVRYEWRASWDLSRMVFNPDELQAHFEALRMADVRRDIQSLVIKLYFERLRLLAEAESPATSGGVRETAAARRGLRVAEIEAQLDGLSGGAFSEGANNAGAAPRAP